MLEKAAKNIFDAMEKFLKRIFTGAILRCGGARTFLPSFDLLRTTLLWMAHETQ